MKAKDTLQSIEIFKVLGDTKRVKILRRLMAGPASLSQLGRALGMHPARVRHHLKQLENADLVTYVSSREVRGFVEKFYQATARVYFLNYAVLPQTNKPEIIFVIGSHDMALELLADRVGQNSSYPDLVVLPVGSLDGLLALRQGYCQVTGCHLLDPLGEEYNISYVRHLFPGQPMHLLTLTHREQGLLVSPENPHKIKGLEDLDRKDLKFINRKQGSGTRLWLDQMVRSLGLDAGQIQGYKQEVSTHSQVAEAILKGEADLGLGVLAAALQYGLDFIPLFEERFDLVIPEENYQDPLLIPTFEMIHNKEFRRSVSALGGYDTTQTGNHIII